MVASSSYDGLIRFWDITTGHCLRSLIDDKAPCVSAVRFTANGKFVLAATLDSTVRLWDFAGNAVARQLRGHNNSRYCCRPALLCSSTDRSAHRIICASEDTVPSISVWSLQTGLRTSTVTGFEGLPLAIDAHPKHDSFVTGELGRGAAVRVFAAGSADWMAAEARADEDELGIRPAMSATAVAAAASSSSSSSSAAAAAV